MNAASPGASSRDKPRPVWRCAGRGRRTSDNRQRAPIHAARDARGNPGGAVRRAVLLAACAPPVSDSGLGYRHYASWPNRVQGGKGGGLESDVKTEKAVRQGHAQRWPVTASAWSTTEAHRDQRHVVDMAGSNATHRLPTGEGPTASERLCACKRMRCAACEMQFEVEPEWGPTGGSNLGWAPRSYALVN